MEHGDYPALYKSADALSVEAQTKFYLALFLHLALLLVAAVISVINSAEPLVAGLQALVLFGALSCAVYLFLGKPDRYWYGARAVAESIKTTAWRYVTRGEPFDVDDVRARSAFSQVLKQVLEQNRDVAQRQTIGLDGLQITDEMSRIRSLALEERQKLYATKRVAAQQSWYASKAARNKKVVAAYFIALIGVNFLGMAFAIARVRFPQAPYWPTDVFVALAASLLAWIQAKRFQELAASYALAAHEISLIREQGALIKTEKEFSSFVGNAENAFSREHTQWVARKDS